ncbi:MAG: hypothetical protein ACP5FH_03545 [Terracidiphilus sp.]
MKFTKLGKIFLMAAISAGLVLSVTSCVSSYTVGYLFVTGTVTSGTGNNGIISGFKIDHNTGLLTPINVLPVSSGGANPVRAVLLANSRFLYVLNRGVSSNPAGTGDCTTEYPCQGSNVEVFAVGGNGILTPQQTFFTQGVNPFRLIADSTGTHLYVLEHDSPDNYAPSATDGCAQALGSTQTTCGDITAFSVDSTTGYLTLIRNQSVTVNSEYLSYFPVPSNPVDFVLSGSYIFTLSGTAATASVDYPYTGGATVFPYNYISTNGQLTSTGTGFPWNVLSDSSPSGVPSANAIVAAGGFIYVLDNQPIYVGGALASNSQILPYTIGSNGGLAGVSTGNIPDDANQSNPIYLTLETRGKWFYLANQGSTNTSTSTSSTGITGYDVNTPYNPAEIPGSPISFGSGSGPQCLVEDPSNQFFYTANINDSSVTGQLLDQNAGTLRPLSQSTKVPSEYTLSGPPTWCLVDGRTD